MYFCGVVTLRPDFTVDQQMVFDSLHNEAKGQEKVIVAVLNHRVEEKSAAEKAEDCERRLGSFSLELQQLYINIKISSYF